MPAVAAGVVVLVGLAILMPSQHSSSAAAAVLSRLSDVARHERALTPGPGEYVYTRSEGIAIVSVEVLPEGEETTRLEPLEREAWIATNGSGRIIDDGESTEYGPGELSTLEDLAALPTDPDELRERIESGAIMHGTGEPPSTFDVVGNLLRGRSAPPELRAALFQVAADLPGVRLIREVRDWLGRAGVAVSLTDRGIRRVLIFDPDTSALLGQQEIVADPQALIGPSPEPGAHQFEEGDILLSQAFSEPAIVGSTQERA